jgi:hypothetical protein
MDLKLLSKFVLAFGILVVVIGGIKFVQYQPLPPPPPPPRSPSFEDLVRLAEPTQNAFGVALLNADRERQRTSAAKTVGLGAAILFGALALWSSAKKRSTALGRPVGEIGVQGSVCPHCGAAARVEDRFCSKCGHGTSSLGTPASSAEAAPASPPAVTAHTTAQPTDIRRFCGSAAGVLVIVLFLTTSQVRGCTGADLMRLSAEARQDEARLFLILALGALALAGLGSLYYAKGRLRTGAACGMSSLGSLILSFLTLGERPESIDAGGWLVGICAALEGVIGLGATAAATSVSIVALAAAGWLVLGNRSRGSVPSSVFAPSTTQDVAPRLAPPQDQQAITRAPDEAERARLEREAELARQASVEAAIRENDARVERERTAKTPSRTIGDYTLVSPFQGLARGESVYTKLMITDVNVRYSSWRARVGLSSSQPGSYPPVVLGFWEIKGFELDTSAPNQDPRIQILLTDEARLAHSNFAGNFYSNLSPVPPGILPQAIGESPTARELYDLLSEARREWIEKYPDRVNWVSVSKDTANRSSVRLPASLAKEGATDNSPDEQVRAGLDLKAHCKSRGFDDVINVDGTGYGWRCMPGRADLNVDQLCKTQFGPGFKAFLSTRAPGGPDDWRCKGR